MRITLPQMEKQLRKEKRRARDAWRGKLGSGRFEAVVKDLSELARLSFEAGKIGSIFGLEGPFRAGLRSDFCLQGWAWNAADLMARDLLANVFEKLGVERPDWYEGQPEWTIEGGTLIERTRCVRCLGPLPEGHFKFCSRLCNMSHSQHMHQKRQADEDRAVHLAVTKD